MGRRRGSGVLETKWKKDFRNEGIINMSRAADKSSKERSENWLSDLAILMSQLILKKKKSSFIRKGEIKNWLEWVQD